MDVFTTRIAAMEHTARERNIGVMHKLNDNEQLFVHWHYGRKCFEYYTVDKRKVRAGVHNLDGFTDLTRESAIALLN